LLRNILLLTTLRSCSYSFRYAPLPPRVRFAILLSRLTPQTTRYAQTIKKSGARLRRGLAVPRCCFSLFLVVLLVVDSLLYIKKHNWVTIHWKLFVTGLFSMVLNSRELVIGFLVLLSIIVLLLTGFLAMLSIIACFASLMSSKLTYSSRRTYP
jgi:predicted ferric reductase